MLKAILIRNEKYAGTGGWTLKQNVVLMIHGKEPQVTGRKEVYFAKAEFYSAYRLGGYPIKLARNSADSSTVVEPTSVELGPPSESEFMHSDKWRVDFSSFESKMERMLSAHPGNPEAVQENQIMRQQLERAKQRLETVNKSPQQ